MKRPETLWTYHRVEIFVARQRFAFERFCENCGTPAEFISLEDAMDTSTLSMREVVRLAESGDVHFAESVGGYLAICARSLPKRIQTRSIEDV